MRLNVFCGGGSRHRKQTMQQRNSYDTSRPLFGIFANTTGDDEVNERRNEQHNIDHQQRMFTCGTSPKPPFRLVDRSLLQAVTINFWAAPRTVPTWIQRLACTVIVLFVTYAHIPQTVHPTKSQLLHCRWKITTFSLSPPHLIPPSILPVIQYLQERHTISDRQDLTLSDSTGLHRWSVIHASVRSRSDSHHILEID